MRYITKKRVLALSLVLLCLAVFASSTVAYFTADATAHNIITSGGVTIDIHEWMDDAKTKPFPVDGISGVMPGTDVTKIVEVENTGSSPAYVRIEVKKVFELKPSGTGDPDLMTFAINDQYWKKDGDFYYYKTELAAGAITEPLFEAVHFDIGMDNSYKNCKATLTVNAYATQVKNNEAPGGDTAKVVNWPKLITD